MRSAIDFEETSGRRFEVALELLSEGKLVQYKTIKMRVTPEEILEVEVPTTFASWKIGEDRVRQQMADARAVFEELVREAPRFAAFVSRFAVHWVLVSDRDKGAVELYREFGRDEGAIGP